MRRLGWILALLLVGRVATAQVPAKASAVPCRADGVGCGGGGSGTVTTTGIPASGQVALLSGATSITGDTGLTYTGTGDTFKLSLGVTNPATIFSEVTTGAIAVASSGSWSVSLDTAGLTAKRSVFFPDATTNLPVAAQVITFGGLTAPRTYTMPDLNSTMLYSGGALGTPSSGTLTNATGLPLTGLVGGGSAKTLTDGSATVFAKVTIASGSTWGGKVLFKLEGKDATDFTGMTGEVSFFAINKAGTITCSVGTPITTTSLGTGGATSTLTAFTCADATANVLNLLCNFTTSLTDSAGWPKIYHVALATDSATYTPQ